MWRNILEVGTFSGCFNIFNAQGIHFNVFRQCDTLRLRAIFGIFIFYLFASGCTFGSFCSVDHMKPNTPWLNCDSRLASQQYAQRAAELSFHVISAKELFRATTAHAQLAKHNPHIKALYTNKQIFFFFFLFIPYVFFRRRIFLFYLWIL